MNKKIPILLLGGLLLLVIAQCKKKEDPQPNNPDKYTVDYKFQITGNYTDLKIYYFETAMSWKEVSAPVVPWEMSFTNFVPGDSVAMRITFNVPAGPFTYDWTWNITAKNGSTDLAYSDHLSFSSTTPEVMPVVINTWKGKLP